MDKVDDESLDVRTVVILIGHDHELAITERFHIFSGFVFLFVLESNDFNESVDFSIL